MNLLREYIRALVESTQYDDKFKDLMSSGIEGIKQAIELAESFGIPSQELPWDYDSVSDWLDYQIHNNYKTIYDVVESTNRFLEPTGWELGDLQDAAKKAMGLREAIRELLSESHFPLTGGEKVRIHHSRQDTRDGKEPQVSGFSQRIAYKPDGLWYECKDGSAIDWLEFCRTSLTGGDSRYDSSYDVILNDYEILFITNNDDFKKFEKMYGVTTNNYGDIKIDWPKVASHYDGIEICPYLYDMRRDSDWYYGWDVASGCVWNASGIKELISADEGCEDEAAA